MSYHHHRLQMTKTSREKLQNCQQSIDSTSSTIRKKWSLHCKKNSCSFIYIESTVKVKSAHLRQDLDKNHMKSFKRYSQLRDKYDLRNQKSQLLPTTQGPKLINLVQSWVWGHLIEEFKYLNRFTTNSARGLFDYDLYDEKTKNRAKFIAKYPNTYQHFFQIKVATAWNALSSKEASSVTVSSIKNSMDKQLQENPPDVRDNYY